MLSQETYQTPQHTFNLRAADTDLQHYDTVTSQSYLKQLGGQDHVKSPATTGKWQRKRRGQAAGWTENRHFIKTEVCVRSSRWGSEDADSISDSERFWPRLGAPRHPAGSGEGPVAPVLTQSSRYHNPCPVPHVTLAQWTDACSSLPPALHRGQHGTGSAHCQWLDGRPKDRAAGAR